MTSPTQHPPTRCHPKTRTHVLEKLIYWRGHVPHPWRDLFWVTGPAGSGKSAIARTFAELCQEEGRLGAALFLSQSNQRSTISRIIPTIAFQLAKRDRLYRDFVVSVFSKDPAILTKPLLTQLRKLLRDPGRTQQYEGHHITLDPLIIILDGIFGSQPQGLGTFCRLYRDRPDGRRRLNIE